MIIILKDCLGSWFLTKKLYSLVSIGFKSLPNTPAFVTRYLYLTNILLFLLYLGFGFKEKSLVSAFNLEIKKLFLLSIILSSNLKYPKSFKTNEFLDNLS